MLLELRRCANCVLASDNVEWLLNTCCTTSCNTLSDSRSNTREDNNTYCSGDNLSLSNLLDNCICGRVYTRDVGNLLLNTLYIHYVYGVAAILVNFVDNSGIYIGKNHMIASLLQHCTNKTASDITGTELNSFFHSTIIFS